MINEINKFENILNDCLHDMQKDMMTYQLNVEKQRILVGDALLKVSISQLHNKIAIDLLSDYIYSKTNYDSVSLNDLVSYADEHLSHNKEGLILYNVLKHMLMHKQLHCLSQTVLVTYQNKGYILAIRALEELKETGRFNNFSKRNYSSDNVNINYRQELSNNINPNEVDSIIRYGLKGKIVSNNIYESFVNAVTIDKQSQCLSMVVEATIRDKSKDETIIALKRFVNDSNYDKNFLEFIPKTDQNKINYRGIMHNYVNPNIVMTLMKRYLINMKEEIDGLSDSDVIQKYVDCQCIMDNHIRKV